MIERGQKEFPHLKDKIQLNQEKDFHFKTVLLM